MTNASMESLPAELTCQITEYLLGDRAFGSVAALAQCSRRLCARVLPQLYDNVGRVSLRAGQDGLIWAVENDEPGTLKRLLECGVDPNARFISTLPDIVRQDVFSAQRLRRRLSPRIDGHLIAKIVQHKIVNSRRCLSRRDLWDEGRMLRAWYLATMDGSIPESLPVRDSNLEYWRQDDVAQLVKAAHFSCDPDSLNVQPGQQVYSWTALHVAVKCANSRAIDMLLAHRADMEQKCVGLCDCLTPTCPDVSATERLPAWSPLHIAICSGHEQVVRALLARGANYLAVGTITEQGPNFVVVPGDITAFHTAALQGDVAISQLLLDHHAAHALDGVCDVLERQDAKGLRALDYAVAAGHTRTTGAWLLDRGVDSLQHMTLGQRRFLAPLNSLCYLGRYNDAQYLLGRIRCQPAHYTLAMQSCFLRLPIPQVCRPTTPPSLRSFLHEYTEFVVSGELRLVEPDSEEALLSLLKQLLIRGADPTVAININGVEAWGVTYEVGTTSALHLASRRGERAAVEVLLDAGAPIDACALPWETSDSEDIVGITPLGFAMLPPDGSVVSPQQSSEFPDFRAALETVSFLLERGASFKNAIIRRSNVETGPKDWFALLLTWAPGTLLWHNSGDFDVFGRIMELVAKQEGWEQLPTKWIADMLYVSIRSGNTNGRFCKWLAQRYNVAPSDFTPIDLAHISPVNRENRRYCLHEPVLMRWMLDFMPEWASEISISPQLLHLAVEYASHIPVHCARVLIERGLADQAPRDDQCKETPEKILEERFRDILFSACYARNRDGAAELVSAVLNRPLSVTRDHPSTLLVRNGEPLASRVIGNGGRVVGGEIPDSETKAVLKLLLPHQPNLYGVEGRIHGERPGRERWSSYQIHPFIYPVPIVVDLGRADLLELIFKETAPPSHDVILEVLAMALDADAEQPEPAVIRTILENTPVDVRALIPRPLANLNNVYGRVPPLYYLLKTFYNAHVIPKASATDTTTLTQPNRSTHDCDCVLITRDKFLVQSIGLLVQHGASWLQPSEPSGETPLNVLADILDGKACDSRRGHWPCHNWNTLRRHVKLDWRAGGGEAEGRVLADGFNPVEVDGLQAKWE